MELLLNAVLNGRLLEPENEESSHKQMIGPTLRMQTADCRLQIILPREQSTITCGHASSCVCGGEIKGQFPRLYTFHIRDKEGGTPTDSALHWHIFRRNINEFGW
jgi:hypothetical protein